MAARGNAPAPRPREKARAKQALKVSTLSSGGLGRRSTGLSRGPRETKTPDRRRRVSVRLVKGGSNTKSMYCSSMVQLDDCGARASTGSDVACCYGLPPSVMELGGWVSYGW